jgi:hypothetical protein
VAQSYPVSNIVRQSQCLMASPGQVLVPRHGQATWKATMAFTNRARALGGHFFTNLVPATPWASPGSNTRAGNRARPPWLSHAPRGHWGSPGPPFSFLPGQVTAEATLGRRGGPDGHTYNPGFFLPGQVTAEATLGVPETSIFFAWP